MNDAVLSQIAMQPLEPFTFKGAANAEVQGFMVKPPGLRPGEEVSGEIPDPRRTTGRVGEFLDVSLERAALCRGGSYVVVMINPHGSTGYGQAFVDAVSGDWGGKPYEDLMKGLDHVEKTYPFIDKTRVAAMGASYGGYMVNWILGHTDRFKRWSHTRASFNTESF